MLRYAVFFVYVVASLATAPPPIPAIHVNVSHPGSGKIINGVDANEGEFPYIVSLNFVGGGLYCGASILTSNWLLTAAHCCPSGYNTYTYTSSIYQSSGGLDFFINETIVHPDYDADNYWRNDICLVRINGNIPFGPNAQQTVLANTGFEVPNHGHVFISGWGFTSASDPQFISDRLQVLTHYYTISDCEASTEVPSFEGHMYAIGEGGEAACQGDSGGPLTYNGIQVGIASFAFLPCAGTGFPDYYTRVANYIPWILENVEADAPLIKLSS